MLTFSQICVDAHDPTALGAWWAEFLGWPHRTDSDGDVVLTPPPGHGPEWLFLAVPEDKVVKNRLHPDFTPEDQQAEVDRALALGARRGGHRSGRADLGGAGRPGGQRVLHPRGRALIVSLSGSIAVRAASSPSSRILHEVAGGDGHTHRKHALSRPRRGRGDDGVQSGDEVDTVDRRESFPQSDLDHIGQRFSVPVAPGCVAARVHGWRGGCGATAAKPLSGTGVGAAVRGCRRSTMPAPTYRHRGPGRRSSTRPPTRGTPRPSGRAATPPASRRGAGCYWAPDRPRRRWPSVTSSISWRANSRRAADRISSARCARCCRVRARWNSLSIWPTPLVRTHYNGTVFC